MMIKGRINWARGLFRLWLLLSLLWMGAWAMVFRPDEALPGYYEAIDRAQGYAREARSLEDATGEERPKRDKAVALLRASDRMVTKYEGDLASYAIIGVTPAVVILVLGAGLLWAFRGFRSSSNNS